MEELRTFEKVASIDIDSYLEALSLMTTIEGKIMENDIQTFYFWLSKYHHDVSIIDGVSLADLYQKNVVEVGMSVDDFIRYCERHRFPLPPSYYETETPSRFATSFARYLEEQRQLQDEAYVGWAGEHGISTAPGSIMRFADTEGNEYRVRTDIKNRGQIIV